MNKRIGCALALALTATLAGCGQGGSAVHTVPVESPTQVAQPSDAQSVATAWSSTYKSDPGMGATLAPPPSGASANISADEAVQTYERNLNHPEWPGSSRTVSLVSYSDSVYGDENESGTVTPTYTKILSWAVIYRHVAVPHFDSMSSPGSVMPSNEKTTDCDFAYMVNATTGAPMTSWSECPDRM